MRADSRVWWQAIKELAKNFENTLNKECNKGSVPFRLDNKKLDSALDMYERSWWTFKKHVYKEKASEEHIDRHKIISLYILSFLIKRPFYVKANAKNKDTDRRLLLANELFSLAVMQVLISTWNGNKPFNMNESEKKWFVILLNYFKMKLKKLKPSPESISDDPSSVTDILSLSQIIYYIEKSCQVSLEKKLAMLQAEYLAKRRTKTSFAKLRTGL